MADFFRAAARHLGRPNALQGSDDGGSGQTQRTARIYRFPDGRIVRRIGRQAIPEIHGWEGAAEGKRSDALLRHGAARLEAEGNRGRDQSHAARRRNDRSARFAGFGNGWRAAAVAVIAGCILSTSARAESFFQVEAGLGGTAYDKGGDGLWYQDAFQHKLELTAPAVKFGVTGDLFTRPRWGIAWHADYVWLGTVHTQAMATPSDANYDTHTKSCVGACWPLADYVGSGHDAGFALTVEPYYNIGPWRFGVEVGPYIHRYSWAVDVYGWRPSADSAPSNIHVENRPRWLVGATAGLTASYRNLSIEYQYFYNAAPKTENVPPIWHGAHVLLAKYRF